MLLFQCDFEMFSTKRLGSFPPVTEWTFVTTVTNRIWWNLCCMTLRLYCKDSMHFYLPLLGCLLLEHSCHIVQISKVAPYGQTSWRGPVQVVCPTAQLRSQPIGTSTTRSMSEGISGWFQVQTFKLTQCWIFPGELPNSTLQISYPCCDLFESWPTDSVSIIKWSFCYTAIVPGTGNVASELLTMCTGAHSRGLGIIGRYIITEVTDIVAILGSVLSRQEGWVWDVRLYIYLRSS